MLQEYLHPVIIYLHQNPHSAGIIAFIISSCEALAVIGTIVPGSVTMTAVGALIGSKVIPTGSTLIWIVCGAIFGDSVSYLIGLYYKERIHKFWPFNRYPHWLEKGENFFRAHGGKSVIIGRFFGPVRSMVPLIAGILKMRPLPFLLAAVPSATIWAIGYITPGILLGALSMELPKGLALEFIAIVLLIIMIIVLLIWSIRYCSLLLADKIDAELKEIWRYLQTRKKTHWITRILTDPRHPENHRQLILAVYTIIAVFLFILILTNVLSNGIFTTLNSPIYHLLRSLRTNIIDDVLIPFTILGSKEVMITSAGLILIWLIVNRYWRTAVHWLLMVLLCSASITTFKSLFPLPRPGNLLHSPIDASFPSGHTCLTLGLIGFLGTLIAQELKPGYRRIPYYIIALVTGLVAFSRLYLGVHYLTDVVGGIFLAITIILLTTVSYRRSNIPHILPYKFFMTSLTIFLSVWLVFGIYDFNRVRHDYTLYWPTCTITFDTWQQHTAKCIPLYRINRLGHPIDSFNIEWIGNLSDIQQKLTKQGWQYHESTLTLIGLVKRLGNQYHLPLLPQTYQNQYPVLMMTKNNGNKAIILRLWKSNIYIKNINTPFWLGVLDYRYPTHKLFIIKLPQAKELFPDATHELIPFLKDYKWKMITYPKHRQPVALQKLHWDGKILLIH
ncbi:MAG: hypothetical protein AMJ43_04190 [Coxiella sp. DG_40]|nr:MAG: hypothetical protein AMJ43_04190 [Coxiella sp. DG_40]